MREDWVTAKYKNFLDYIQPSKYLVDNTDYHDSYDTPVLTAGKTFILGYTKEEQGIFSEIPVIIFDDFTTASKYVNFKFKAKSSAMKILKPTSTFVNLKFIYYSMQINQLNTDTHKRYWISIYAEHDLAIPPLLEQKAIVSKIEQLFSELDNGIQNLKIAQQKLKIYRQAVLKKAFEGELTKEWREKQTNLPTADELLEKIKKEREEHYQKQLGEWKVSIKKWEDDGKNGKKPSKPRKKEQDDNFKKDNLPKGWIHCPIKNLGLIATGATPLRSNSSYWTDGTIPWIKSGALNSIFIKKADEFTTIKALEETNIKLFPKHTLVIALYGEGKTRGLCSELLIETTTNQAIAGIIQTGLEEKTRVYLKHFLLKNYQDVRRKSSGGVQPNLNSNIVKNTLVPLCSLQEQTQIVQEIESRLSVCDNIETTITATLQKAEALRQSILKKAYEGKLLTEDELQDIKNHPDYESAEELLKRIRQERQQK